MTPSPRVLGPGEEFREGDFLREPNGSRGYTRADKGYWEMPGKKAVLTDGWVRTIGMPVYRPSSSPDTEGETEERFQKVLENDHALLLNTMHRIEHLASKAYFDRDRANQALKSIFDAAYEVLALPRADPDTEVATMIVDNALTTGGGAIGVLVPDFGKYAVVRLNADGSLPPKVRVGERTFRLTEVV